MRRLIINADDLGINSQRTHGIFQCMEFGVVTNTSIIPCCTDSDAAAKHARERGVKAGLHINLTEEYALSPSQDISSLVETDGRFFDRHKFRSVLAEGKIERSALERELRAQVEWMFDSYGFPTHIDSHHHVHVEPLVADVLIEIMERYGIRLIRMPIEEPLPPYGYVVSEEDLLKIQSMNDNAKAAKELYDAHGITYTDHFRGLSLVGNASLKNLRHVLSRLPEGTTELMVHPGSAITFGTPFDVDPQRQTELRMLLDESIPALLAEKKVELCSYADV